MKHRSKVLQQIAHIRELQRVGAEVAFARAILAQKLSEDGLTTAEQSRDEVEQCWRNAISETFSVLIAGLWSDALLRHESDVREAKQFRNKSVAETKTRTSALHTATMRRDRAKTDAESAMVKERQRREEELLQDTLDRHARLRTAI